MMAEMTVKADAMLLRRLAELEAENRRLRDALAAARTAVPALTAEVDRLRAFLDWANDNA